MLNVSMVRAKCYLILQGLERSLSRNIIHNCDVEDSAFLVTDEQERALNRLRDDMEESEWGLEDVRTEDLLMYLDLGDLVSLLNRHKSKVRNARRTEIQVATQIVQEQRIAAIRKRVMHPVRPLEADDLPILMSIAKRLQVEAPSLIWEPMIEGLRLAQSPRGMLDVNIPPFWAEEPTILHNLPPAEFDDTGFIGRGTERRNLKSLLESDHSVITVVGAGGIGKTALALRVCHDILDDVKSDLERIVWVSLKTQFLTADGIRTVVNAVDTGDALVDRLLSAINIPTDSDVSPTWDRVMEQMKASRILLVIDNLETLGLQIRDLAVNIPRGSKLLLTSRVGLGEIELRYEMPNLSTRDAGILLRHLGVAYNYEAISSIDKVLLTQYCKRLHYNPLLIKWFVQAVGKGARPQDVLSYDDLGQALRFCWENVYDGLTSLPVNIISTLLAARRSLSQTQLQELLEISHISLIESLQELHQSNVVERSVEQDGSVVYQIGSLVLDYLSRYHPPDDTVVKKTRIKLRNWQLEQERSAVQQNTYRYAHKAIHIDSNDERIAAPHLRNALNMMRSHSLDDVRKSLERAQELTPQWWEVHRIKARFLEKEGRPIYEIEQAFEESISYKATDVNRFHYAAYLLRIQEYERALEQIEHALVHPAADGVSLRSIKGLVLLRSGRISEALEELEYVWESKVVGLPRNIRRVQGTQFAGALGRRIEQLCNLGNISEAEEVAFKAISIIKQAASDYGWDWKLVEESVKILAQIVGRHEIARSSECRFIKVASRWDSDDTFRDECRNRPRTHQIIQRNRGLLDAMPNSSKGFVNIGQIRLYRGVVRRVIGDFGFIYAEALGEVHMNRSSLVRLGAWQSINIGQKVVFAVRHENKGPHAVELELEMESNCGETGFSERGLQL